MKVAIMQLFHESSMFTPVSTSIHDFEERYLLYGDAVKERFLNTKNWLGGVLQYFVSRRAEVAIGLCAAALPGGVVDRSSYQQLKEALLESFRKIHRQGKPELVILLLHGAMAVEGVDEPEGEIVAAVRKIMGSYGVLGVTVDFHANLSPLIVDNSHLIVSGQTYPHVDTFERGLRIGELLVARMTNKDLETHHFRLPVIMPMTSQTTEAGAFAEIIRAVAGVGAKFQLPDVSVTGGFPYADFPWVSMGVLISCTNYETAASAFKEIAATVRRVRAGLFAIVPTISESIHRMVRAAKSGTVVVADTGDNPGAGAPGDSVILLKQLLNSGYPLVAGALVNPGVVNAAQLVGEGGGLKTNLKSVFGPDTQIQPAIEANVERIGPVLYRNKGPMMTGELIDGGMGAVLKIANSYLLVTSKRIQIYDCEAFISQGIPLHHKGFIMVKSSAHFRASFEKLATGGLFLVDSMGWSSSRLENFNYQRIFQPALPGKKMGENEWNDFIQKETDPLS